jgi:hypothetical protein
MLVCAQQVSTFHAVANGAAMPISSVTGIIVA